MIDVIIRTCKYCCRTYKFIDAWLGQADTEIDIFRKKYRENETNHYCIIPIKNKYMNINIL